MLMEDVRIKEALQKPPSLNDGGADLFKRVSLSVNDVEKPSKVPVNVSRSIFPNNAETTRYLPKNWGKYRFQESARPHGTRQTKRAPEFRDNQAR